MQPALREQLRWKGKCVLGLDARNGLVATDGWLASVVEVVDEGWQFLAASSLDRS